VVRKVLLYTMEIEPVSFDEFSAVAFDSSLSASSLYAGLAHGPHPALPFKGYRPFTERAWLHCAVIVIGTYLLVFPTIVSTMTGYQSNFVPYTIDPNNIDSQIKIGGVKVPDLVVQDSRVGHGDLYLVYSDDDNYGALLYCTSQPRKISIILLTCIQTAEL